MTDNKTNVYKIYLVKSIKYVSLAKKNNFKMQRKRINHTSKCSK